MTNLELFPRGKGTADEPSAPPASGSRQDDRKRKAASSAASPRDGGGKEKEWLFGAGDKPSKPSSAGKRHRGERNTAAAAATVSPGASKGKVRAVGRRQWCNISRVAVLPGKQKKTDKGACSSAVRIMLLILLKSTTIFLTLARRVSPLNSGDEQDCGVFNNLKFFSMKSNEKRLSTTQNNKLRNKLSFHIVGSHGCCAFVLLSTDPSLTCTRPPTQPTS